MDYSYKNTKGERVTVTEEHLKTAVAIKEELQKLSPTRRCSWFKHKQLMQQEGYMDSDTNENYRCLIKHYQHKIGQLPSVAKHAEMIASNKLQAIKDEIGNINSAKLALQEQARKVRKLVRDTNKDELLIEEIGNAIRQGTFVKASNPVVLPDINSDKDADLIVCLSDIHYGAHVDIPENYYDTKVVARLMNLYAEKVIKLIEETGAQSVDIVNLGDIVEHAYMRNQNLYDSEETLSEQIVNVTRLIIGFIQRIRNHAEIITYRGIAGNHDRMQGDKNSNLNADHAVNISNRIIQMWIEVTGSDVQFVETDSYFAEIMLRGYHFAFVHGDRDNLSNKATLAKVSENHDRHYDAVIGGHVHKFSMLEVGNNRYQVTFGSFKGMDDYSKRLGVSSSRSQGVVIVNDKGFEIRKIGLQ